MIDVMPSILRWPSRNWAGSPAKHGKRVTQDHPGIRKAPHGSPAPERRYANITLNNMAQRSVRVESAGHR